MTDLVNKVHFELTRKNGLYSVNENSKIRVCDFLEVVSVAYDCDNNFAGKVVVFVDATKTLKSHTFTAEDLKSPSRVACHLRQAGMSPSIYEDLIFKYISETTVNEVAIIDTSNDFSKNRPRPF
jgi:hypothetical protein